MTYVVFAVIALVTGYVALVRYHMRRPIAARYNRIVALWLGKLAPRMQCISLWTSAYMRYPHTDKRGRLSPQGWKHERFHIEAQWAKHPYAFPFMYLWEMRKGYDKNKYEQAARRAAGEPER